MTNKLGFAASTVMCFLAFVPFAHAQWWNPNDPMPGKRGLPGVPPVVYDRTTFESARTVINAAIWSNDFRKIERMYEEFQREDIRTTDGGWMVESVQQAFDTAYRSPENVTSKLMASWESQVPESRLRPVIEAVMWQRLAWNARGGGYASTVPGEGMQIFRERLAQATRSLEGSAAVGKESPIWYWAALVVAGSSGRPASQFDALFDEAASRFRTYFPFYETRANYLLPIWGGSFETVDQFIGRAVARTEATEGQSYYARLYVFVATRLRDEDLFTATAASWPKMKRGFDDLVARYPSLANKNLYATFACRARDKETVGRLLQELGDSANLGAASPGVTTESCRRFAIGTA